MATGNTIQWVATKYIGKRMYPTLFHIYYKFLHSFKHRCRSISNTKRLLIYFFQVTSSPDTDGKHIIFWNTRDKLYRRDRSRVYKFTNFPNILFPDVAGISLDWSGTWSHISPSSFVLLGSIINTNLII